MAKRHWLVVGTFLLAMLLYVDRVCISAAKDAISADLSLTDTQFGWVLSAFALGYALLQTPAGALADRRGPRVVLTGVVAFWSFFTGMTALARGFASLLAYRFLFGAGEAGAFPGCARAFHSWLPVGERGLAQGVNFSGSRLGAAFALPVVAAMVAQLGWRASFLVLSGIGFAWAAGWWLWFRDDPAEDPGVSDEERALILRGRELPGGDAAGPLPLRRMLASRNVWLAMGQYFCSNFTFFFCLTWLFPHLRATYRLEPVEAGLFAAAPLLAGAVGNWTGGGLVDAIYRRGSWGASRRWPAMIGFALAAAGLVGSARAESALAAVTFLSVAIFGADMTLPPSWSLCIDIGRRHAGKVSGTMNMAGNLGSFVTGLAFPYLRQWTGSTTPFFLVGAGLNVLAILAWAFTRPEVAVDASGQAPAVTTRPVAADS